MPKLGMTSIRINQVITATLKCIALNGINNITQTMVAKQAGVSKGIVTYYFESKDEMIIKSCNAFLEGYLDFSEDTYCDELSIEDLLIIVGKTTLGIIDEKMQQYKISQPFGLSNDEIRVIVSQIYSMVSINDEYKKMYRGVLNKYFDAIKLIFFDKENGEMKMYQYMAFLEGMFIYDMTGFIPDNIDKLSVIKNFVKNLLD